MQLFFNRKCLYNLSLRTVVLLFCFYNVQAQIQFSLTKNYPQDNILSITEDTVHEEIYVCTSTRVYVSTDKGISWNKIVNPGSITVNTLYCTSSGKLFVGVGKTLTNPAVGMLEYDRINNKWVALQGSPFDITSIIEEKNGHLLVGTGNYDNYKPLPINKGTGFYRFAADTWSPVNSNFGYVPGTTVFPAIRQMIYTEKGILLAATYGNGIWKMENETWFPYDNTTHNSFINCISQLKNGAIIIGTDDGIEIENNGIWSANNDLKGETVRVLTYTDSLIILGTGAYHWQTKPMEGTVYISSDYGNSWKKNTAYPHTVGISEIKRIGSTVLLAGTGLWLTADGGSEWKELNINTGGNRIVQITTNKKGDMFALCTTTPQNKNGGGVFKSTDRGESWACIVNGLKHQRGNFIFCDMSDKLWCGLARYTNNATNSTHDDAILYYSENNGGTWLKDSNILKATNYYSCMTETPNGTLYITNGWGGPSNISSTSDSRSWNNDLNMGEQNGGLAFNCSVNGNNFVFVGTETQGILRSGSGERGTFQKLEMSPKGNSKVFGNPFSGEIVATGGRENSLKYFYGAKSEHNGDSMFAFSNFPDYSAPSSVIFGSKGTVYIANQAGLFENTGLYTTTLPISENSVFEKVLTNNNISYYFTSMSTDECGYLYGCANGIYVSDKPIHRPLPSTLKTPQHNSVFSGEQIVFKWENTCVLLSHTLHISTDSDFTNTVYRIQDINDFEQKIQQGILQNGNTYFWRIISKDVEKDSSVSNTYSFVYNGITSISYHDEEINSSGATYSFSSEKIQMNLHEFTNYKIVNILGTTVREGSLLNESSTISLDNLLNGVYLIILQSKQSSKYFTFNKGF